jgi:voltage-gated potassium channel Kch
MADDTKLSTEIFCDYCQCHHHGSSFSENSTINEETIDWYKEVTNDDEAIPPLKVCETSYSVLKNRHNNYYIIKEKEAHKAPGRKMALSCAEVTLAYVVLVAFIILGALPIWAIESANEYKQVVAEYSYYPSNYTQKWTYGASIYYTVITMTTVGYGDFSPSTRGGRAYMEVLALFGLGFTGATIGVISAATLSNAKTFFFLLFYCCKKVVDKIRGVDSFPPDVNENNCIKYLKGGERVAYKAFNSLLFQSFVLYFVIWVYIIVGGAIFARVEGWEYQEAHWYCFVTLTTIGYGDFYPKTSGGRALCCLFSLGGIGLLASFFGIVGAEVISAGRNFLKWIQERMDIKKKSDSIN